MKQHIKTVKEFNNWKRDGFWMPKENEAKRIGEAIDEVVKSAERTEELEKFITWLVDDYGYQENPLEILKRAESLRNTQKEQCRKCGAEMKDGKAIEQTYTGMPDFIGGECCTISPGGSGKLIECKKCPECGWSVTK